MGPRATFGGIGAIHQTADPVAHPVSGDPNHYDRYFFNGFSPDGGGHARPLSQRGLQPEGFGGHRHTADAVGDLGERHVAGVVG